MIYRKWSLLTSTGIITGGVFGAVLIANTVIFGHPLVKPQQKKQEPQTSK